MQSAPSQPQIVRRLMDWQAKSSRNAERHQIGMLGDIIADSRATSPGIRIEVPAIGQVACNPAERKITKFCIMGQ
jgi:hypothetical protein